MGRFTSVQSYSDRDNKSAVPYSEVKGDASAATSTGGSNTEGNKKFTVNKVENIYGSTAGAGSGEFHVYRAQRRREQFRLESMAQEHKRKLEQEDFDRKRRESEMQAEEKAKKNAAKRKRKKQKKIAARKTAKTISQSNANEESNGEPSDLAVGGIPPQSNQPEAQASNSTKNTTSPDEIQSKVDEPKSPTLGTKDE